MGHEIIRAATAADGFGLRLLQLYFCCPQITQITQMIHAGRDSETYSVIGAAMEVHRVLGPGFLEAVYQQALVLEFDSRGISFQSQPELVIDYKGTQLAARYRADFVCATGVVVELKALRRLCSADEAQMLNYLKASRLSRGLLLNFGSRSLEYRRFVHSHEPESA